MHLCNNGEIPNETSLTADVDRTGGLSRQVRHPGAIHAEGQRAGGEKRGSLRGNRAVPQTQRPVHIHSNRQGELSARAGGEDPGGVHLPGWETLPEPSRHLHQGECAIASYCMSKSLY